MSSIDRIRGRKRKAWASAAARWNRREGERLHNARTIRAAGPGAADSTQRQELLKLREAALDRAREMRRRGTLPIGVERKMGPTLDFGIHPPSETARRAGRPVARIVDRMGDNLVPRGIATGFLAAPNLLLTNNHVFDELGDAVGCGANFLYEHAEGGVQRGRQYAFAQNGLFVTDPALDYTVIELSPLSLIGEPLDDIGFVTLIEATPKILIGHPVNIVQHPEGAPKTYAFEDNRLLDIIEDGFLHYTTDTLEGSSGSPVFNKNWELVGLHRASIPRVNRSGKILRKDGLVWREQDGDDAIDWIANEGTRVSALVRSLRAKRDETKNSDHRRLLDELIRSTADPAKEVLSMMTQARDEEGEPIGAVPAPRRSDAATTIANVFHISGPVTINMIGAPDSGTTSILAPAAAKAAAGDAAPERALRFDTDYAARAGYDPYFLDADEKKLAVPLPTVSPRRAAEMLTDERGDILVLHYHHFSLAMNKTRRLQMWSAVNVNYHPDAKFKGDRKSFGSDKWIADPRVGAEWQITDPEFYKPARNIDRGHMVRREDNCWGHSPGEIEFANSDTFHWTNCTPQHEAFNQSAPARNNSTYRGMAGLWGDFENHVQSELTAGDGDRACILSGPVLLPDDPGHDFGAGEIQYPLSFWKVVVVRVSQPAAGAAAGLRAFAFVFSQGDVVARFGIERFQPGRFERYRHSLKRIEDIAGIVFHPDLHAADRDAGSR